MILDQLVLHNVGTFAGKNVLDLTPPSRDKPVVLIGGLNGAGKTTVLEAINLALYGSLAHGSGRRSGSYDNYLRGLIHRGVPHTEGAVVELAFHAHQQGAERHFRLRRSWRSTGKSIREILLVQVDGRHDSALTTTWSDYVETFLPRGIAGLFFFDGEQIEALADLDRSREVLSSALAALLGLDLVDRLSTDLAVIKRRHRTQQVPDQLRQVVDERALAVTAARQTEEQSAARVAALRVERERASKLAFELTERYRAAGGELLDQRDTAEARFELLKVQVGDYEDELRAELSEAAPMLQVHALLRDVATQVSVETLAARERVVSAAVSNRDAALLSSLRGDGLAAASVQAVATFLAADRQARAIAADVPCIVGLTESAGIDQLLMTLAASRRRVEHLVTRRNEVLTELEHAERVIVAIPDAESPAPLLEERDSAHQAAVAADAQLQRVEDHLSQLRQERARCDNAYEVALTKAAQAGLAADDGRRLTDHLDRVQTTLQRLREAAEKQHLDGIGEFIHEALGRLMRKSTLITHVAIDPKSLDVRLTGADGHTLSAYELSAGERQLLAVALLWGLARASGQPLPVVIDTPLGRLDGAHRAHLLERYFPEASHQVILLSTDTEIDESAYRRLSDKIGRSYRLSFIAKSNSTSVEPGYFWK